jgi:hypothetical protein
MGTWDVGLFADDTALDVRDAWIEPVRRGRISADVTAEIIGAFGTEDPVVWLALAETQWRWGRLEDSVRDRVIALIDSDEALGEWAGTPYEAGRRRVLRALRRKLESAPPPPKTIKPPARFDTEWERGEVVGYRLTDDKWTLIHVIGHDPDYGGRAPICVFLDYVGDARPEPSEIARVRLRRAKHNPVAWTQQTVARVIERGIVPPGTTPAELNAKTRMPHPTFTIGAFRKGERPAKRIHRTGVRREPSHEIAPALAIGVRWCHLDGYLAAAFDLPPQPEGHLSGPLEPLPTTD